MHRGAPARFRVSAGDVEVFLRKVGLLSVSNVSAHPLRDAMRSGMWPPAAFSRMPVSSGLERLGPGVAWQQTGSR
jgi:hypothetical protein